MSKCMTIDETTDQKDTFSEVIPKDIVDSVLEEILISVLTISDKGCNRIGDFSINEDFCQQYNQPIHVKDFEQANINQASSAANLYSDRNKEHSGSGNENPGTDRLGKTEEKIKPAGECKVISEEILADNELQIQNGQIHLERVKNSVESAREEYYKKEDVIKDEKIEIEYYNQGKLNKIYVPLNDPSKESNPQPHDHFKGEDENNKESEKANSKNENESPFKPFTSEDLRQVWGTGNSSLVGKWDGDVAGQREEVAKLMEGLSNIQVYADGSADPNRPRTCSVAEEDVKKMIKEIEEINFIQSHDATEDYPPDGQGDADLESKSFTRSKDILNKSRTESWPFPENDGDDIEKSQAKEICSSEIRRQDSLLESIQFIVEETDKTSPSYIVGQESRSGENVPSESFAIESNLQNEAGGREKLLEAETLVLNIQLENSACMEDMKDNTDFSATGSVGILESHERIFSGKTETVNSRSISGNDIFSEFMVPSEIGTAQFTFNITQGSVNEPWVSTKLQTSAKPEEVQNTHSRSIEVIELPSDGKVKPTLEDDSAENVTGYKVTEVLSHGGSSCSENHKPSGESVAQSKKSGSLQSQESSTSSDNQSQEVEPEKSESGKFKLRSEKMYLRMGFDPAGFQKKKEIISKSQEAFIESMESILQIIEPEENGQEEACGSISFSPLSQETEKAFQKPSSASEEESTPNVDVNDEDLPGDEIFPKRVCSGMTTIGPMKNSNYDPRDLMTPDIDFGKMTRITSSRQLAKDFNLLGADMASTTAMKIVEENDSDESTTASDNDCLETVSLVNRDIASLTKVQKIREVMSYQPKLEDDFEDEEVLPKPRLDLKDVESMSDERYKVPDVTIPLCSFEVTAETIGSDAEAEKQLIESMGLIISGLTEPYYENLEGNMEYNENNTRLTECSEVKPQNAETKKEGLTSPESVNEPEDSNSKTDTDVPFDATENESKYGTLGSVIKKASSKFMKKESDVLLRSSKSLPRDTSKIITTESIKSILDDCSTSASNVLKKSCSMLRNTQSLFKTISQSRMSNDGELEKHKISPSESDVSTVERKLSFLKKEDFAKAKNLIKSKMEKTFKRQENSSEADVEQPEVSEEKKELQVVIRNEEKLRVDRMENFKRWLPKSPLVYKSQFVKSQMKIKDKSQEADATSKEEDDNDLSARSESSIAADEEAVILQETAWDIETTLQQEENEEALKLAIEEELDMMTEETQPDYIIMETIEGLPTSDLESSSSEKRNMETNVTFRDYGKGSDHRVNKTESQAMKERELDIAPDHRQIDDKMASKIPSERKAMAKKKKLSARLRNFWCSAFGRIKTSPKKLSSPK